jgi:hypothetical protein
MGNRDAVAADTENVDGMAGATIGFAATDEVVAVVVVACIDTVEWLLLLACANVDKTEGAYDIRRPGNPARAEARAVLGMMAEPEADEVKVGVMAADATAAATLAICPARRRTPMSGPKERRALPPAVCRRRDSSDSNSSNSQIQRSSSSLRASSHSCSVDDKVVGFPCSSHSMFRLINSTNLTAARCTSVSGSLSKRVAACVNRSHQC